MTLNELKDRRLTGIEVEDDIVKLTFESGHWLKFNWAAVWCGRADQSASSPELRSFLKEMKQRRVAQEAHG